MKRIETQLDPLLQALESEREGPAVVAIGGGHGLGQALRAACRYAGSITAVVTVADNGGSSGRLASAFPIPPPGNLRQCLLALTPDDSVWRRMFDYRFADGDVAGHILGDLLITGLSVAEGDLEAALRAAERLLGTVGSVTPAAPRSLKLLATIDEERIEGRVAISRRRGDIEELWLEPGDVTANRSARDAIAAADQIVLGPGSLYTSIIATVLVPGIAEAINRSLARLVYVTNLATQDGETLGMDAGKHLDALLSLTGLRPPTAIVANAAPVVVAPPLQAVHADPDVLATYGTDVESADLLDPGAEWPRHDPARLGGVLDRLASG